MLHIKHLPSILGEVTMRWLVQISKQVRYVSQAWGSQ
ncbi:hypothetical protein Pmani_039049, partial [Petrolisthes manimaculis]